MEDWAEIRRLRRAERMPISQIARVLGVSRNTVRSALGRDGPPRYVRKPAGSIVDAVEPRIRELLKAYPMMPATVIAERIGWTRSIRVLLSRVAELRPLYLPPDPASRTSYEPGEILGAGAYLGEMIVRNSDWTWVYCTDENAAAVESPEELRGYPHNKVAKRIHHGAEHDLEAFFKYAVTGETPLGTTTRVIKPCW